MAVALAGAGAATYGYGALTAVQELAVCLGVAWLAVRGGMPFLKRLGIVLPAAALLQVGYVLFRRLAHDEWRSAGTFFNPNHLAAWLVAALLLLAGSRDRRPSTRESMLLGGAILVLFTGQVLSGSRGAFIGLGAGALYLIFIAWRTLKRRERIVVVAVLTLAGAVVAGAMIQRFRGPDRFSLHRTGIWSGTIAMVADNPWTGVGPNQFNWSARQYQFDDGEGALAYDHLYSNSHSDWLRLPAEFGIPGTVFLILSLFGSASMIRKRRKTGTLPPSSAGAVAALLALLVQAAFQNLSHSPAVYLTAAALIGGLLGRTDPLPSQRTRNRSWRGSVRLGSLAGCAVLLITFIAVDVGPYLAYRLTAGQDRAPTQAELQLAVGYNRIQPYIRMSLAESYLSRGALTLEAYQAARVHGEEAVRLHAGDAELRRRLARIEARGCRELYRDKASRERAHRRYLEAEKLAPFLAMIPLEAGDFLYTVSDFHGAIEAADRVLILEPGSVPPRLLKATALLAGDGAASLQQARSLRQEAVAIVEASAGERRENKYAEVMLEIDPDRAAVLDRQMAQISR
jgi:O-antigen ligase